MNRTANSKKAPGPRSSQADGRREAASTAKRASSASYMDALMTYCCAIENGDAGQMKAAWELLMSAPTGACPMPTVVVGWQR